MCASSTSSTLHACLTPTYALALAASLAAGFLQCEEVQFIDVREQHEFNIARLPNFKLLPLSESSEWAPTIQEQLDPAAETVVLCHHGVRSMNAAMVSWLL
jgi:rhodanese-related sulfurtransferase